MAEELGQRTSRLDAQAFCPRVVSPLGMERSIQSDQTRHWILTMPAGICRALVMPSMARELRGQKLGETIAASASAWKGTGSDWMFGKTTETEERKIRSPGDNPKGDQLFSEAPRSYSLPNVLRKVLLLAAGRWSLCAASFKSGSK